MLWYIIITFQFYQHYNIFLTSTFLCSLSFSRFSHLQSNFAFFIIMLNFSFLFLLRNRHLYHWNTGLIQILAVAITVLVWWSCNCPRRLKSLGKRASGRCQELGFDCGWCRSWISAVEKLVLLAAIAFVVGFDNYSVLICYLWTCPCRWVRSLRGHRWSRFVGVLVRLRPCQEVLGLAWATGLSHTEGYCYWDRGHFVAEDRWVHVFTLVFFHFEFSLYSWQNCLYTITTYFLQSLLKDNPIQS